MLRIDSLFSLALLTTAIAAPHPGPPQSSKPTGCGEVDIIFTGLPPYHPLVTSQGFDPAVVDAALRADAARIVASGYNLRVVLVGPEQPVSVLEDQMRGVKWDGTGVGYGVRGSRREDLTIRLEEIIQLYRDEARWAPIMFDHSPDSAFWAVERHFPLSENCTGSPGTDLVSWPSAIAFLTEYESEGADGARI